MKKTKSKIQQLMDDRNMTFREFSSHFSISKQTLTKKLIGTMDWTFEEILIIAKIFQIEEPSTFFYS